MQMNNLPISEALALEETCKRQFNLHFDTAPVTGYFIDNAVSEIIVDCNYHPKLVFSFDGIPRLAVPDKPYSVKTLTCMNDATLVTDRYNQMSPLDVVEFGLIDRLIDDIDTAVADIRSRMVYGYVYAHICGLKCSVSPSPENNLTRLLVQFQLGVFGLQPMWFETEVA